MAPFPHSWTSQGRSSICCGKAQIFCASGFRVLLHVKAVTLKQLTASYLHCLAFQEYTILKLVDTYSKQICIKIRCLGLNTEMLQCLTVTFGAPKVRLSDDHPYSAFTQFIKLYKCRHIMLLHSTKYHPESKRAVKRAVQIFKIP